MTDHHDPEELASAHLDGATSAQEAARVAADPALEAQVEAMRAVRAAIRQPVEVDAGARDAAVAAALAAFDEAGTAPSGATDATVTPIAPRRSLSPTARRALGAAAVVAVLALLVPLLAQSGDDDHAAESADARVAEGGGAIDGDAEASGDSSATAGEPGPTSTTDLFSDGTVLGTYDDVDALLAALDERGVVVNPQVQDGASSPEALSAPPCPTASRARDASELGVAIVAGRHVVVALLRDDQGVRVLVVDASTCELLADERR